MVPSEAHPVDGVRAAPPRTRTWCVALGALAAALSWGCRAADEPVGAPAEDTSADTVGAAVEDTTANPVEDTTANPVEDTSADTEDAAVEDTTANPVEDTAPAPIETDTAETPAEDVPDTRLADIADDAACLPTEAMSCCGDAVCVDFGCGEPVQQLDPCAHGCQDGACLPCLPQCEERECGDDGCGGSCGACLGAALCEDGRCLARVTARFLRERRVPNAALTALTPLEVVSAAHIPVLLSVDGVVVVVIETDDDGRIDVELESAPTGPVQITLVANLADASGEPLVSILDSGGVAFPTAKGVPIEVSRMWAWTVTAPFGSLAFGDVTVTVGDGAGALQLLGWLRDLRERTVALYGDADAHPSLAILWSPGLAPPCLACFLPAEWGPVRLTAGGQAPLDYGRAIWLSGTNATPYHWTPSMVGHEYGHYVMDVFSRAPDEGGAHSWVSLINPAFAWSEGFATFFGQWWLSPVVPNPRFFSVQSGTSYWLDIERIGTPPTSDDSSFADTPFPLPQPDQPLTQDLNEAVVAAILWDLWDEVSQIDEPEEADLGDLLFEHLASERMLDPALDRGYWKVDLVDLLDAIRCADALTELALRSALMGLPYDGALRTCPD